MLVDATQSAFSSQKQATGRIRTDNLRFTKPTYVSSLDTNRICSDVRASGRMWSDVCCRSVALQFSLQSHPADSDSWLEWFMPPAYPSHRPIPEVLRLVFDAARCSGRCAFFAVLAGRGFHLLRCSVRAFAVTHSN